MEGGLGRVRLEIRAGLEPAEQRAFAPWRQDVLRRRRLRADRGERAREKEQAAQGKQANHARHADHGSYVTGAAAGAYLVRSYTTTSASV